MARRDSIPTQGNGKGLRWDSSSERSCPDRGKPEFNVKKLFGCKCPLKNKSKLRLEDWIISVDSSISRLNTSFILLVEYVSLSQKYSRGQTIFFGARLSIPNKEHFPCALSLPGTLFSFNCVLISHPGLKLSWPFL